MKVCKLSDIAEVQTGPFGSQLHSEDYVEEGTPIVTVEHLGNRRFTIQNLPFVSNEDRERLSKYSLREGDIVFSRVGAVDRCSYVTSDENGWLFSGRCLRVRCHHECDALYLYYYFCSDSVKEYVRSKAVGATMLSLNTDLMLEIPIQFPQIKLQKEIAKTLSFLDSKIELNRQINDNLEAMAKQLYDYWFVQFDFPNDEGKPYKSSGGAMVWNEKLKREIPQGLGTPKIGDIEKNIITGKTPSCADEDNFGGDIPFVTIDDIRGNLFVFEAQRTLSTKGADSQEKKYLPIGSLSVSCIGTIGVMGFVARLAQTNQQINSIVFEHEYNKEFLYFSLKLYFENAKAKTGNVFANMSKEEFASIIVAYPPKQILQAFHNKVAPIFDSIKNNTEEINSLTKQRDELLPLLMNGQATVNYHLSDD